MYEEVDQRPRRRIASSLVVLVLSLALVLGLAWGVARLSRRLPAGTFGDESPTAAQEQGLPSGTPSLRPGMA